MAKKTKRSHSTTPSTPHSSTASDSSIGDHHVKHSPSPDKDQKRRRRLGFFGLLTRTLTMGMTIMLIVVMYTIALANVKYLIRGNHPAASWARSQLERGLNEPLIDHTLHLSAVDLTRFWPSTSSSSDSSSSSSSSSGGVGGVLHDLISLLVDNVSWLKGRGEDLTVHVTVHTRDIPYIAILLSFALVLLSSPFRLLCAIFSKHGRVDNVQPRTMYLKLSERGGLAARAQAAHENSIEAMLYLVAGVMVAIVGTTSSSTDYVLLAQLCIVYIAVRILYHLIYIPGFALFGVLRSLVFIHGVVALVFMYTMPIHHVIRHTAEATAATAAAAAATGSM